MKKYIFLILALYGYSTAWAQNNRLEIAPQPSPCYNLETDTTKLYKEVDYKILTACVWKLDQMYINEVASNEKNYANISLVVSDKNMLIWINTVNGQNKGKDYPVKFSFFRNFNGTNTISPCKLSSITTYHKYNNTEMDTYQIVQLSLKSMILTCNQKDKADPSFTHTIEYRFVPKKQPY